MKLFLIDIVMLIVSITALSVGLSLVGLHPVDDIEDVTLESILGLLLIIVSSLSLLFLGLLHSVLLFAGLQITATDDGFLFELPKMGIFDNKSVVFKIKISPFHFLSTSLGMNFTEVIFNDIFVNLPSKSDATPSDASPIGYKANMNEKSPSKSKKRKKRIKLSPVIKFPLILMTNVITQILIIAIRSFSIHFPRIVIQKKGFTCELLNLGIGFHNYGLFSTHISAEVELVQGHYIKSRDSPFSASFGLERRFFMRIVHRPRLCNIISLQKASFLCDLDYLFLVCGPYVRIGNKISLYMQKVTIEGCTRISSTYAAKIVDEFGSKALLKQNNDAISGDGSIHVKGVEIRLGLEKLKPVVYFRHIGFHVFASTNKELPLMVAARVDKLTVASDTTNLVDENIIRSLTKASYHISDADMENYVRRMVGTTPSVFFSMEDFAFSFASSKLVSKARLQIEEYAVVLEPSGLVNFINSYKEEYATLLPSKKKKNPLKSKELTKSEDQLDKFDKLTTISFSISKGVMMLLTDEPKGGADTRGYFMQIDLVETNRMSLISGKLENVLATLDRLNLYHLTEYSMRRHIDSKRLSLEIDKTEGSAYSLFIDGLNIVWMVDLQFGISAIQEIIAPLKTLKRTQSNSNQQENQKSSQPPTNATQGPKKPPKILNELKIHLRNSSLTARFPDGPSAATHMEELGPLFLTDKVWTGQGAQWIVGDTHVAYIKYFAVDNSFVGADPSQPKKIDVTVTNARIVHPYGYHYGMRWADFNVRLKAYLKYLKELKQAAGLPPKPKSLIHMFFRGEDIKAYIEDHPINGFLTKYQPLMFDEAAERNKRMQFIAERLADFSSKQIEEIEQKMTKLLLKQDSLIWIERVKKFKANASTEGYGFIAPGLTYLKYPPIASAKISKFDFSLYKDKDILEKGTEEHMRRFQKLDDCKDPEFRKIVDNPKMWTALGFRKLSMNIYGLSLSLQDMATNILETDLQVWGDFGFGVQLTVPPFVSRTVVALGERTICKISKAVAPVKLFIDANATLSNTTLNWNTSMLATLLRFFGSLNRYSPLSREPSPAMPIFDTFRCTQHGRMSVIVKDLQANISPALSPYAVIDDYLTVEAKNFKLAFSRLEDGVPCRFARSSEKPVPCVLSADTIVLCPKSNRTAKSLNSNDIGNSIPSKIIFHGMEVALILTHICKGGKSNNHYIHPFPKPGEKDSTDQIIETVDKLPEIGLDELNRIKWDTDLARIPNHDTFEMFRSTSINYSVNISLNHDNKSEPDPEGGYLEKNGCLLHSESITTLRRILRYFVRPPVQCRAAPRVVDRTRKPPSKEKFGTLVTEQIIHLELLNFGITLINNLENHGLRVLLKKISFGQHKRRAMRRTSDEPLEDFELLKRQVACANIFLGVKLHDLDIGGNKHQEGFLMSSRYLAFSAGKEAEQEGSGSFFSSIQIPLSAHSTQSHRKTSAEDDVFKDDVFNNVVRLSELRVLWTPSRRNTLWYWPRAFQEKSFRLQNVYKKRAKDDSKEIIISGQDKRSVLDNLLKNPDPEVDSEQLAGGHSTKHLQEKRVQRNPIFHLMVNGFQMMFAGALAEGLSVLSSRRMILDFVKLDAVDDQSVWITNETTVHFESSYIFTVPALTEKGEKGENLYGLVFGRDWVPFSSRVGQTYDNFYRVTTDPFNLELVYSSASSKDENDLDIVRPSHLRIKTSKIAMRSTLSQFNIIVAIIVKVLMLKHPSTIEVQDELAALKFKFLLAGLKKVNLADIEQQVEKYKMMAKHLDYAVDSKRDILYTGYVNKEEYEEIKKKYNDALRHGEYEQLREFLAIDVADQFTDYFHKIYNSGRLDKVQENLQKYLKNNIDEEAMLEYASVNSLRRKCVAKSKALLTYMTHMGNQKDRSSLFPSLFLVYSFDKFNWTMVHKEDEKKDLFKLELVDLICRNVFYLGRENSQEYTIGNINLKSLFEGCYYDKIIHTEQSMSRIKSTEGENVVFKLFLMQTERVGGIPVIETMTFHLAPLNAAITMSVKNAFNEFLTGKSAKDDKAPEASSENNLIEESGVTEADVQIMQERGLKVKFFKYVYIGEIRVNASFKWSDTRAGPLDFKNLQIEAPSGMYSSKLWGWGDFLRQLKADVIMPMVKAGAGNYAKLKLLQIVGIRGQPNSGNAMSVTQGTAEKLGLENFSESGSQRSGGDAESLSSDDFEEMQTANLATLPALESERRDLLMSILFGAAQAESEQLQFNLLDLSFSTRSKTKTSMATPMKVNSASDLKGASARKPPRGPAKA